MRRNRWWFYACFPMLISTDSAAQYYLYKKYYEPAVLLEWGIGGGLVYAFTDLGGNRGIGKPYLKDVNLSFTKPSALVYLLAQFKQRISLRLQATIGTVHAADSILKNKGETFGRYDRNLHFRSRIREAQGGLEIHPAGFRDVGYEDPPRLSCYIFLGAGYYHFNPRARLENNWFALEPLHTEGQGFKEYPWRQPYRLQQWNMALGPGIRFQLDEKFCMRLELIHRFLFTDYLDDVSTTFIDPLLFLKYLTPNEGVYAIQLHDRRKERNPAAITRIGDQRGNPENKDAWMSFHFKLGYVPGSLRK